MIDKDRKNRIKKLQNLRNFATQADVAKEAGISEKTYRNYLEGKTTNADTLIRLADVFGVSVDYLLYPNKPLNIDDVDIHLQTGLSFGAIDRMRQWKRENTDELLSPPIAKTVSLLIEQFDNISVLPAIHEYLKLNAGGEFQLLYRGYDVDGNAKHELLKTELGDDIFSDGQLSLSYWDWDVDNTIDLNEDVIVEARLSMISGKLRKLRDYLIDEEIKWQEKQDEEYRILMDKIEGGEDNGEH